MAVIAEHDVGIRIQPARVDRVGAQAAEHHIGARARGDDVARPAVAVADHPRPDAELEGGETVVAQHDIRARTRGDGIAAGAADHEVVAVTGLDPVVAAVGGVGRGELDPHAGLEHRVAVVADDDVAAAQRRDDVGPGATDDEVVTAADLDLVVAAEAGIEALGTDHATGRVEGDVAVIAEHDVGVRVGLAGIDRVAAEAAEHEIRAGSGGDRVASAADPVADDLQTDSACKADRAVVAQHDVGARAGRDGVGARATQHDVVAVADRDPVVAGARRIGRDEDHAHTGLELGVAAIADHRVVAAQRDYDVAAGPGDDHVVAGPNIDRVVAAEAEVEALGPLDATAGLEGGATVVTEHDVVAAERGDPVGTGAADDDVVAAADIDAVVVPEAEIQALGALHAALAVEGDVAVVAEDDVGIGIVLSSIDRVGTQAAEDEVRAGSGSDGVGSTAVAAARQFEADSACEGHGTVVAQDDVGTGARGDGVGTRATEDDVVARAGLDAVVATAGRIEALGELDAAEFVEGHVAIVTEDDVVIRIVLAGINRVAAQAADHEVGAGTRPDRVARAAGRIALGLQADSAREGYEAVVAQDDVGTGTRGDRVGARAADDDIVAATGIDAVVAAGGRIGGLRADDATEFVERDVAVVTEDDVVVGIQLAGVDRVAAETADDEVGAGTGDDRVTRAARQVALDLKTDSACEDHTAVVAQHDICAGPRGDRVRARAAEDQVGTRARQNLVVATERRIDTLGERDAAESVEGDVAVAAEDDVRVRIVLAGIDRVAAEAAEDEVGAGTGDDGVATATADALAESLAQDAVHEVDGAVIAEHEVGTDAGGDGVAAGAAEHDVVAVARADDVVARHALVLGRDAHELALREGRRTVVAEDDVEPGTRGDVVGADAAEHHVVALARHDGVAAAEGGFHRLDRDQDPVQEHGAAVVAEDHVGARSGLDLVGPDAADDDAAAIAEGDLVACACRGGGGRRLEHAALRVEGRLAVVAEHRAAAVASRDDVAARTAEDHGHAVADSDRVVTADVVVGRLDHDRQAGGGEPGMAGIAEDDVGAGAELHAVAEARSDAVATGTADDGVAAAAERDRVLVADLRADAGDLDDDAGLEIGLAAVAEHDVVAVADGDRVAARAAEHDVVAVADGDRVVAADRGVERERALDQAEGIEGDDAVVAQDDRALVAAPDRIAAHTAEHDVVARAEGDRVASADGGRRGGDARQHAGRDPIRHRHGEVGLAAVTEDDVVARAGGDGVATRTADDP